MNTKSIYQAYGGINNTSNKLQGKKSPWLVRTAAYIPIVVFALGTNEGLPKAQTVERKVAHAKLQNTREFRNIIPLYETHQPNSRRNGNLAQ